MCVNVFTAGVCVCVRVCLIVCLWEVGCGVVEATCVPSVQEIKEGESESKIHPQPTCKTRAGPRPATESGRGLFVFVRLSTQTVFHLWHRGVFMIQEVISCN